MFRPASFGQGTGVVWLDQISCWGYESRLLSCSHGAFGNNSCTHAEDVSISCGKSAWNFEEHSVEASVMFLTLFYRTNYVRCETCDQTTEVIINWLMFPCVAGEIVPLVSTISVSAVGVFVVSTVAVAVCVRCCCRQCRR